MDIRQLDEQYFEWLYKQVADPEIEEPSLTSRNLLYLFFRTEFVWMPKVSRDENRIQDGKALRFEFVRTQNPDFVPPEWMNLGCSILELMIGLARHLAFMEGGEPPYWFWILTENIGLRHYTDDVVIDTADIEETLNRVIYRRYNSDGSGGFFPLKYPDKDQRGVELWYQMNSYVLENFE